MRLELFGNHVGANAIPCSFRISISVATHPSNAREMDVREYISISQMRQETATKPRINMINEVTVRDGDDSSE